MLSDLSSPSSRSDAGRGEFEEAEEDEVINVNLFYIYILYKLKAFTH